VPEMVDNDTYNSNADCLCIVETLI